MVHKLPNFYWSSSLFWVAHWTVWFTSVSIRLRRYTEVTLYRDAESYNV